MRHRGLGWMIVLGGMVAVAVTGCASSETKKAKSADDVVAERQRIMRLNGASWADAQAKGKAGNWDAIAVNAETMALNAMQIPALFPAGTLTEKSKAKPEVWQKWPEFEAAAKAMVAESEKLRDASRSKNQAATEAAMKDFGRNACGACHTPFRVPPPQR